MLSDIEIAQGAILLPIADVAAGLGLASDAIEPYGHTKAKLSLATLQSLSARPSGKLVLVTAISPTPAGEGKTTTTVGLVDALQRIGRRAIVCLREPSLGPVFGRKGGAAGGGYAQVVPMDEINLHFTGDFHAVAAAHNLLAALIDNHQHHGNALGIDAQRVSWKRVLDVNDRALRHVRLGGGGASGDPARAGGFDIVAASEVMAILCLATSLADLRERLGDIIVAQTAAGHAVRARDLQAQGAMTALLREAIKPNLVQTLEGSPALIHGGPFANIAHGCNSVMATRAALQLADIAVTETGFGADLGAEKFIDIKCRQSGLRPDLAVLVATVRALKYHGGAALTDLANEDLGALAAGLQNLERHLHNLRDAFGLPCVVAINAFDSDSAAELELLHTRVAALGVTVVRATHWAHGGAGAEALAHAVVQALDGPPPPLRLLYADSDTLWDKALRVARTLYGAAGLSAEPDARARLDEWQTAGFGHLPICVAKTPYSFSSDAALRGAPSGHTLHIRDVRLAAGARFVVLVCGDVMTMPGLPKRPNAERIDVAPDGRITGLS